MRNSVSPTVSRARRYLLLSHAVLIAVAASPGVWAQNASASLKIVVIEGEGAVNIIQQKTAVTPVVEVRDRNNLPVSGATVTFSVGSNSATFAGGAQTLTVTTNAAGRAAAAALNPLGGGSFQIQVSAAFQGQTAAATIAQTNVVTAVQAAGAAGASGGAGGASTAAAAGGGGGGLSGATIGIIGAAIGGGAIVAKTGVAGDLFGSKSTTYSGPVTGQIAMTITVVYSNHPLLGNLTITCESTRAISGTLTMTLEERDGTVAGKAETTGTMSEIAKKEAQGCDSTLRTGAPFGSGWGGGEVTGTPANLAFTQQHSAAGGGFTTTDRITFSGTLSSGVVAGTISFVETAAGMGQQGEVMSGGGSTTMSVTLR